MTFTLSRRGFLSASAATFATGVLARPARAQTPSTGSRNLVIVYFAGGNDGLTFLPPYLDKGLYQRRTSQFVPPDQVHQIGTDSRGSALGLHTRLPAIADMYNNGHVAFMPRVGYEDASRSHFLGADIWQSADLMTPQTNGWLGRYFDTLPAPVDPLVNWNTQFQVPRAMFADRVRTASIVDPAAYSYYDPWGEARAARDVARHMPESDPHLTYLNETSSMALDSIGRVSQVVGYQPTTAYPANPFGKALSVVASAIAGSIGTKVFWVQTAGFDTHARQGTMGGTYAGLMDRANSGLSAFYTDLRNQGLLDETLILQFSEFGRRIDENGSAGTDHGAAGTMMAIGGKVRGGIYGDAAITLARTPDNPDLENGGRDLRPDVDFRSVYAAALDRWLGADSQSVLGADFRDDRLTFV